MKCESLVSCTLGRIKQFFDVIKYLINSIFIPLRRRKNYLSDDISHIYIMLTIFELKGESHSYLYTPRTQVHKECLC